MNIAQDPHRSQHPSGDSLKVVLSAAPARVYARPETGSRAPGHWEGAPGPFQAVRTPRQPDRQGCPVGQARRPSPGRQAPTTSSRAPRRTSSPTGIGTLGAWEQASWEGCAEAVPRREDRAPHAQITGSREGWGRVVRGGMGGSSRPALTYSPSDFCVRFGGGSKRDHHHHSYNSY